MYSEYQTSENIFSTKFNFDTGTAPGLVLVPDTETKFWSHTIPNMPTIYFYTELDAKQGIEKTFAKITLMIYHVTFQNFADCDRWLRSGQVSQSQQGLKKFVKLRHWNSC